jgi:hypothetical protein
VGRATTVCTSTATTIASRAAPAIPTARTATTAPCPSSPRSTGPKLASSSGCVDDSYEDNDTRTQAQSKPAIGAGTYNNLKICPGYPSGDDEDWYRLSLGGETNIQASINGGSASDLDFALYDSAGVLVTKSDSLSSQESIQTCVQAGTYYLRVYAWDDVENSYSMSVALSSQSCGSTCQDDLEENDDNESQARYVDLNSPPYESDTNAICSWDDDWYEVLMFADETLYATLTFTQQSGDEDLDLYIYRAGQNLTGCSESTPGQCDPFNGQSGTSNERMEWPITMTDTYYLVVHGWEGSENLYDICIGLEATDCP